MNIRVRTVSSALRAVRRLLRNASAIALATPAILTSQVGEPAATRQIVLSRALPALKLAPVLTLTDAVLDTRRVSSVAVSAGGEIVVTDGAERLIVFSASGARVRTIGRAGAGPGEFKGPL